MFSREYKCDHCGFAIAEPHRTVVIDGLEYDYCTACHNDLKLFTEKGGRLPLSDWEKYTAPLKQWPQPSTGWLPRCVPDFPQPFVTYCRVDNALKTLS